MQSNRLLGTERNAPPALRGRTDELSRLAGYAEYVFRNSDPSGGIVLIDGVPGSGKTQLMRRFVERQQASGNGVLALAVTTADIPEDAKSLMFLIASAMPVGRRNGLGNRRRGAPGEILVVRWHREVRLGQSDRSRICRSRRCCG